MLGIYSIPCGALTPHTHPDTHTHTRSCAWAKLEILQRWKILKKENAETLPELWINLHADLIWDISSSRWSYTSPSRWAEMRAAPAIARPLAAWWTHDDASLLVDSPGAARWQSTCKGRGLLRILRERGICPTHLSTDMQHKCMMLAVEK